MNEFPLEIVTPIKLVDEGEVDYVRCPGLDGSFGVMANHQNAIIALGIGEIKVTQNKKDYYLAGGISNNKDIKFLEKKGFKGAILSTAIHEKKIIYKNL